jgi:hypothetical protein
VAQAFKLANRADPRLDTDSNVAFILQRQLRAYKGSDRHEKQQVAVTGSILRKFIQASISTADKAMSELFTGAFFFAMRSCEYLNVSGPRTKEDKNPMPPKHPIFQRHPPPKSYRQQSALG